MEQRSFDTVVERKNPNGNGIKSELKAENISALDKCSISQDMDRGDE